MWLSNLSESTPTVQASSGSSAAQRTLAVGELLENILLFNSQADVLRCRRVNRKFLETITYSKPLRQNLFLEPRDPDSEHVVNPLGPAFFNHKKNGYRDSTIAARIDLVEAWNGSTVQVKPLWHNMYVSQPPTKTCVIPTGSHTTIFFRRYYEQGMTFGDLERAVIAAFDIKKGRKSSRERLEELSLDNSVLIYWN